MNFAHMSYEELVGSPDWDLAVENHPSCSLPVGWSLCRGTGFEFPEECPNCGKPIPGDRIH